MPAGGAIAVDAGAEGAGAGTSLGEPGPAGGAGAPGGGATAAGAPGALPGLTTADGKPAAVPLEGRAGRDVREAFALAERSAAGSTGGAPGALAPRLEGAASALEDAARRAAQAGGAAGGAPGAGPTAGAAAAASSSEPKDEEILQVLPGVADRDPAHCRRHGEHEVLERTFGRALRVRFAHSCDLVVEDPSTGEPKALLEGRRGQRWALGLGGEPICAWTPGERPVLHRDLHRDSPARTVLSWPVPAEAEAVAVGRDCVAYRIGSMTRVLRFDGQLVGSGQLSAWDEGVLFGSSLAIAGPPEGEQGVRQIIAFDRVTLRPARLVKPPRKE
ncbi:MAG: hypothetical protein HY721_21150 [Planctomycetes bacterium]|nr:hypothetical protein [Planctomycetota bacterium]